MGSGNPSSTVTGGGVEPGRDGAFNKTSRNFTSTRYSGAATLLGSLEITQVLLESFLNDAKYRLHCGSPKFNLEILTHSRKSWNRHSSLAGKTCVRFMVIE